jgi:1,4-alpha-glucan branching enzyme
VAKELKKETFSVVAPDAATVLLVGDFTGWQEHPVGLKRQKDGIWKATVPLEPGAHEYRFIVDGQWRDDAQNPMRRPNPFGESNCVREVAP